MIELQAETLVRLAEAAKHLPKTGGKSIHRATLWRWATTGVGGVILQTIKIGGATFTSLEALQRFVNECSERAYHSSSDPIDAQDFSSLEDELDQLLAPKSREKRSN